MSAAYEIVMPQLGLTMTEGSVSTWLKQPGDWVAKGEMLFTVQTDKVEMEVESFGSGYLSQILVKPEQMVPVGTLLATLSEQMAPEPSVERNGVVASPRARRLARELGVDLESVVAQGSRITEEDVRRHVESRPTERAIEPVVSPARKTTARRMTESFQSAPHFYLGVEANAAALVGLKETLNSDFQNSVKLTYTDFFLKALAIALAEHSHVNAFWGGDGVVARDTIDIAFAVQARDSLLAPMIRHADRLDLLGMAARRHDIVRKARDGSLAASDLEGGSATLSNLGASVDWFQAILNPPQSVILATGRIAPRAVVVNGRVEAQPTVHLNLSVDHRVLDGVAAAAFLGRIQKLIERPYLMLVSRA